MDLQHVGYGLEDDISLTSAPTVRGNDFVFPSGGRYRTSLDSPTHGQVDPSPLLSLNTSFGLLGSETHRFA